MTTPRATLAAKLSEAFAEPWDPKRPAKAEVFDVGERVGVRFFVMTRTGEWVIVHEETPMPVLTEEDADGLLARGLSIFLMKHPAWPP